MVDSSRGRFGDEDKEYDSDIPKHPSRCTDSPVSKLVSTNYFGNMGGIASFLMAEKNPGSS